MEHLTAQRVTKCYENKVALDHVSLSIPKGSIYGLLGPNGSGKTTLLRIFTQMLLPDEGKVFYENEPLQAHHTAKIGYLPEERGLYKKMQVKEQLVYFGKLRGFSTKQAEANANYWIAELGLQPFQFQTVRELSKGWQQKVQFAAAVLHNPDLVILDEPFTGFDPLNAELIKNQILALQQKGKTVVLSVHRMETVEELCQHICLIYNSKKIIEGELWHIKNKFKKHSFYLETDQELYPENYSAIQLTEHNLLPNLRHAYSISSPTLSANELLALLMPHCTIFQFREQIPSLHQIFFELIK